MQGHHEAPTKPDPWRRVVQGVNPGFGDLRPIGLLFISAESMFEYSITLGNNQLNDTCLRGQDTKAVVRTSNITPEYTPGLEIGNPGPRNVIA